MAKCADCDVSFYLSQRRKHRYTYCHNSPVIYFDPDGFMRREFSVMTDCQGGSTNTNANKDTKTVPTEATKEMKAVVSALVAQEYDYKDVLQWNAEYSQYVAQSFVSAFGTETNIKVEVIGMPSDTSELYVGISTGFILNSSIKEYKEATVGSEIFIDNLGEISTSVTAAYDFLGVNVKENEISIEIEYKTNKNTLQITRYFIDSTGTTVGVEIINMVENNRLIGYQSTLMKEDPSNPNNPNYSPIVIPKPERINMGTAVGIAALTVLSMMALRYSSGGGGGKLFYCNLGG